MIKTLKKLGMTTQSICEKPTMNITFNGERVNAFPLISGTCPFLPLLFSAALKILARTTGQEK